MVDISDLAISRALNGEELTRRDSVKAITQGFAGLAALVYGLDKIYSPKDAFAGGTPYKIDVTEFYNRSKPVDDDSMPKGLRVHPFDEYLKEIKTRASELPEAYKNGLFTNYYFDSKYNEGFRKIFSDGGHNPDKIENFLKNHRNEKRVSLYKDGFFLLSDANEKMIYILPLSKTAIQKIIDL